MSERGSARRRAIQDEDPVSRLQATIDQAEIRRGILARRAGLVVAAVLVVAAAGVVLALGKPAVADVAALPSPEATSRVAVPSIQTTEAVQSAEPTAVDSALSEPLAPSKKSVVPKPVAKRAEVKVPKASPTVQTYRIAIGVTGYRPSVVNASASSPIVLSVQRGEGCAAGFLIPGLGVDKDNSGGPVSIRLGRVPAGSYQFSCGMEMVTGTLIVN